MLLEVLFFYVAVIVQYLHIFMIRFTTLKCYGIFLYGTLKCWLIKIGKKWMVQQRHTHIYGNDIAGWMPE